MILFALGLALFYGMACTCLGRAAVQIIGNRAGFDMERENSSIVMATSFLLGQGLLAGTWIITGLKSQFTPQSIVGILCFCVLIGFKRTMFTELRRLAQEAQAVVTELKRLPHAWKAMVLLICCLFFIWGTRAFTPVIGDGDAFYMAVAKVMAAAQKIVPLLGYENMGALPLLGEMHFAALMSLGSYQAGLLFVWLTSISIAVFMVGLGKKMGIGLQGKIILLAMLSTTTSFSLLIGDGKTDLFGAAMGLAALYWAVEGTDKIAFNGLMVGLFAGFSCAAKISYLGSLLPALFLLSVGECYYAEDGNRAKVFGEKIGKMFLWMSGGFIFAYFPQLVKNEVLLQAPFAPFLNYPQSKEILSQTWFATQTIKRIVLTYPFALVYGNYWGQYGNLSPLVLAFFPLTLLYLKMDMRQLRRSSVNRVTVAAILVMGLWVAAYPSALAPRYFLASLLLFCLPVAYATERMLENRTCSRGLKRVVTICILIGLLLTAYLDRVVVFNTAYDFQKGRVVYADFNPVYQALSRVNAEARSGERLFLATYSHFQLRNDLLQCASTFEEQRKVEKILLMEERWAYVYYQGFHYVIVDKATHARLLDNEANSTPYWLTATVLYEDEKSRLIKIESNEPQRLPRKGGKQIQPPAWDVVDI